MLFGKKGVFLQVMKTVFKIGFIILTFALATACSNYDKLLKGNDFTAQYDAAVKYYNEKTKKAYDEVERTSVNRLLDMLPEELKHSYETVLVKTEEDAYLWRIVKAADTINALIKCIEEEKSGNREFAGAKKGIEKKVRAIDLPEVKYYVEHFLPSFALTLDEHTHA